MVVDVTKLGTLVTKPGAKERLVFYTAEEWQQIVDHYSYKEPNVDGKECRHCFFDEMHVHPCAEDIGNDNDINVYGGNCLLHTVKSPFFTDQEWKRLSTKAFKGVLKKMKDEKQKQQTIEWLNTSIQRLEDFKSQVEDGKIVMTDGYMDDNYPVPQLAERTDNNLSLSIDFIEKQTPPGQNF